MYGFYKIGCSTPEIRVADCAGNAQRIVECVRQADEAGAHILCLPELCITGYTCADLFLQDVYKRQTSSRNPSRLASGPRWSAYALMLEMS